MSNRIIAFLAHELGVENIRNPWQWLLRLFILPPAGKSAYIHPLIQRGIGLVAREFGVRDAHNVGEWLLRLFTLPRGAGRKTAVMPAWLGTPLFLLIWPLHFARARLARVDFSMLAARLEKFTDLIRVTGFAVRVVLYSISVLLFWLVMTTPLTWIEQGLFAFMVWALAMFVRRIPGNAPVVMMMTISVLVSSRYMWWRVTESINMDNNVDLFFAVLLLLAELYTWLILLLGYFQTAWPLKRKPVLMPTDVTRWPSVDVFIPTYNEPLKVLKPTVFAAMGLDWPREKLNIYILDDGDKEEIRQLAEATGVHYLTRPDNSHAKAGNLNHALKLTHGEYIAIFDCDHIPARSFLQIAMGWFFKDPQCVMLQTPHHFFSPDPFERNLGTYRRVPNEGELFYGLVQDGNDLWNASFFCGSCAVLKRGPLEEVGGIAVETVTEDAHTALKLHRLGYTTAYLQLPQAAGLATESLSAHIGQRIRWARGMAQIFRTDNPMLGKGLALPQRLCYSNAMLHFFYGIPRLIFLTAPLTYLLFHVHIIYAGALSIVAYVLPHLIYSNLTNSRIQGKFRHSFWAEVYESVLAWYITLPTTIAFINPKHGKFNVTAKGGLIDKEYFDWSISKPYLLLIALNLSGLAFGLIRLFWWNSYESGTVILNLVWTVYNVIILGAVVGVATEARQVRLSHRVRMLIPATLYLANGRTIACRTEDFSEGGLGLNLPEDIEAAVGGQVHVGLSRGSREFAFRARIVMHRGKLLGLRFEGLTLQDEMNLVHCTFGRADAWAGKDGEQEQNVDRPLDGLREIVGLSALGYKRLASVIRMPAMMKSVKRAGWNFALRLRSGFSSS